MLTAMLANFQICTYRLRNEPATANFLTIL